VKKSIPCFIQSGEMRSPNLNKLIIFKLENKMKKLSLFILLIVLLPVLAFSQLINGFEAAPADTNYWQFHEHVNEGKTSGPSGHYLISSNADPDSGWLKLDYVDDPVFAGDSALQVEYSVHNTEAWGGFSMLNHWHPDSNKVYDFSAYDSISIMYYNMIPASKETRMELRLCLHDVSDADEGAATYSRLGVEYYYSFHKIFDMEPGWNEIKMPLEADPNYWTGQGFNLTGWVGISGNGILDKDQIKGFTLEFVISGSGEGDAVTGTVILDQMMLKGVKAVPFVFFNGKNVPSNISLAPWGGSTIAVEEGAGATEGTNALKWVQGDEWSNGWSGISIVSDNPLNMSGGWDSDSIKFKMKAQEGTGAVRLQFEDGTAKIGKVFTPVADGEFHDYAFKLSELEYMEGTSNFNTSAVSVLVFMAEGNAVVGQTLYIDDLWTGTPVIDIIAPQPPLTVDAVTQDYYNLVIWEDVEGESGEVYDVFASQEPITALDAPGVDQIASGVLEDTQSAVHWIYYPLEDTEIGYYYAVKTRDAAGNESETFTASPTVTTNTAKGIATISLDPPADFVADGDLSEWDASGIMPFVLSPETAFISTGVVDDADDLTGTVYLAMDADYLYVAVDVIDNVYNFGEGDWWLQDAFEMFLGLYNRVGPKHAALQRGDEPDYKIVMNETLLFEDLTIGDMYTPSDENYHFEPFGGADYVAEAKIPLDSLAQEDDARFTPIRGMRIPIEITFHDNDGTWEGNVTTSALNKDNAWQTPSVWFETWIGDTTAVVTGVASRDYASVINSYNLSQNYPNPFNPTTTINYSLQKSQHVEIVVFNRLGQKVKTLVNSRKPSGSYRVSFNADGLSSGVYFYRFKAGDFEQTRKMILMK
jgi:hypothetical protein